MARTATQKLTEHGGAVIDRALDPLDDGKDTIPGPSPNPATNLLITSLALRGVSMLARQTAEKGLLRSRYGSGFSRDVVENRSLGTSLASYAIAKLATRSVPGALLVGGGLLAKTLYDRSLTRGEAGRRGKKSLNKAAKGEVTPGPGPL